MPRENWWRDQRKRRVWPRTLKFNRIAILRNNGNNRSFVSEKRWLNERIIKRTGLRNSYNKKPNLIRNLTLRIRVLKMWKKLIRNNRWIILAISTN